MKRHVIERETPRTKGELTYRRAMHSSTAVMLGCLAPPPDVFIYSCYARLTGASHAVLAVRAPTATNAKEIA